MFFTDEDKQGNVVRCIEIIGEAANHLDAEIINSNPEVPWPSVIGMRNNLIHGYPLAVKSPVFTIDFREENLV